MGGARFLTVGAGVIAKLGKEARVILVVMDESGRPQQGLVFQLQMQ